MTLGACTTTTTQSGQAPPGSSPEGDADGTEVDPDDPANQPPHSLGTIMLGESHVAGSGGTSYPIVSVSFVPDAMKARSCKKKLDESCEIVAMAKCTEDEDSVTGCGDGEACVLDDSCAPACKKIAVCSKECDDEEICTLDKAGKAICAKPETFDAGPIAFSGTTTPITLYPPYSYEADGKGAPFLAGAEIKVQAQGAVDAGFEKFDEAFTATTFIQPSPALNKISREKFFGTGALPVAWKPGSDAILVTMTGPGGTVTCKAKDAEGKFDVPRSAIDAALGDRSENEGAANVSLSVSRQRKETRKGHKAKGELSQVTVQPEGWLDLVTVSTEATSFQGCPGTQAICGDGCANLQTDPENCGSCGKVCSQGMACGGGKCVDPAAACDACFDTSKTGACKTSFNACKADASCNSLWTCVEPCTNETCVQTCLSQHPDGQTKLQAFFGCAQNACADVCN